MPSAGSADRKPVPGTGYMHTIGPHMVREYPIIFDPARVGCLCTPGHVSPAIITTNSSSRDEQPSPGNCARHISYSGDTTADNVSSPKPRTCGVYSKDTPKRAGDNGGTVRGYQGIFVALAAQQSRLWTNRTVSPAVYLYIAALGANVLNCRVE